MSIAETWNEYWEDHSREAEQRLVLQYAPLVKYGANRWANGTEADTRRGIESLTAAIEEFRPEGDGVFVLYALERLSDAYDPASWDGEGWREEF